MYLHRTRSFIQRISWTGDAACVLCPLRSVFINCCSMAVAVLILCWLIVSFIVGKLIERYRNPRTTHHTILLAVFLSWLFPISITFLLPIDITSTRYEQCLVTGGDVECTKSWLYVDAAIRHASWLVVYWATFILSWYEIEIVTRLRFLLGFLCHSCKVT